MAKYTMKLILLELFIGILIMIYEFITGHPWTEDGVPWTMEENFHFTIALAFFVSAGFTLILGGVIGAISRKNHSHEKRRHLPKRKV